MPPILLTGASGYLGSALTMALEQAQIPYEELRNEKGTQFRFGDNPDRTQLQGSSALIHLAWMRVRDGLGSLDPNVVASMKLFDACVELDTKFVFISSYAVLFSPHTWYAESKRLVERYIFDRGGIVIRPALVVSHPPQSAFGQLTRFHKLLHFLPTRAGKPIYIHTIALEQITQCCINTVLNPLTNELLHNCGKAFPVSLQVLVQEQNTKIVRCIPIPQWLLSIVLFLLKKWSRTSALADSIDGLYNSSACDSDLEGNHV